MKTIIHAAAVAALFIGCAGLPQTSRTAVIHEVKFEDKMMPADLTVNVGDEIRWVNHRTLPVRIDIPGLKNGLLSCDRGFSNAFGSTREVTELDPGKSASLCFAQPVVLGYNARMKSAVPGGMAIEPGTLRAVAPTR
ncbi:MAG: hypothetical protein NBKEAIPA_00015 [Nitrospirae bacterium]|nr:MAG: hypothetical protein UZ03_NOB001001016 [Nitrospira sp. OLB3]MBV6468153.1 hypothetical protein [Nitrospirota bacterium]MCK6494596.1 hypothetical protein [Nitrospira sp.]MEB2338103.1 hypothetical protein [Nitrospirales bacterium]QOJ35341.1 MAG: hypothetical protein HRU82_10450 [Nitrospira sp.]